MVQFLPGRRGVGEMKSDKILFYSKGYYEAPIYRR